MGDPVFAVPYAHFGSDLFDRKEALIGQYRLSFCDAGQLGHFTFLPEVSVYAVLLDRDFEHLGRGGAVDIPAAVEYVQPPLLVGEPRDHTGFDC